MGDVIIRQVEVGHLSGVARCLGGLRPALEAIHRRDQGLLHGGEEKIGLVGEVRVEATVGETHCLHDGSDGDSFEALLPEHVGRRGQDRGMGLVVVLRAVANQVFFPIADAIFI